MTTTEDERRVVQGITARLAEQFSKTAREPVSVIVNDVTTTVLLRHLLDEHVSAVQTADGALYPDFTSGALRLRVSVRRLRSTLSTFRPLLDPSVDALRKDLAWLSTELGAMRDAAIVGKRMRAVVATERGSAAEAAAILEPLLALAYGEGLARAQHALRSERYADLSTNLSRLFGSRIIVRPPAEQPARDVLPALAAAELTGIAKFSRQIARANGPDELDQVMHRLRLATKRACYATRALQYVHAGPGDKLARDLKGLQSLLGERHDSTITRRFLAGLREAEGFDGPAAALIERHIAQERALTATLDQKVPSAARKVIRRSDDLNG